MNRRNFTRATALALAFAGLTGQAALAAEHEVQMLNRNEEGAMVFEPSFLRVEPGDVIHFLPADKSHNVESIKGMLPAGTETFKSRVNDPFDLTVTETGLYGIKCTPHFGMGMVMVVQVGEDASNLDALQQGKLPKRARERMDAALANVN